MNSKSPALAANGISAGYNGRTVLSNLTLRMKLGESVALIGPNGCGKSTLLRVIAGILPTKCGTVDFLGKPFGGVTTDERIRRGLGYLKQNRNIFASLTVEENMALAAESMGRNRNDSRRTKTLLNAFPVLGECFDKRAGLLSGGQRQALAVAMVLVRQSKLLLLDEPVAGLSTAVGSGLLDALRVLQTLEGFAMLIVEHRLRQVQPYVDRVIVMREGQIVEDTDDTIQMLDVKWLATHYVCGDRHL